VPCDLHLWAGQVHDFVVAGNATPESRHAIKMIGRFVHHVTAQHPLRAATPTTALAAAS
jgi:acetyl esterase/lipase